MDFGTVDAALHVMVGLLGAATAILLYYSYRRMGAGHMNGFNRWLVAGVCVISASHVIGNFDGMFGGLPFHVSELVEFAGLALICFSAWELFLFSKNIGGGYGI
ncbi:MAG: hypothetical protein WC792_00020 [Candidatus Micrarchaeia archaeon]|jgi:hypothetical protein